MNNSSPCVSILVPVYNVEKYLEECIDSIVNQTLKDIEIICINDGSTDGSLEILESYAKKDSRVKVISKKNTGYGNSMNVGIDNATGEYIGIVESDDFAELDMFETLYNEAKKNDLDVARSEFFYYKTSDNSNRKSDNGWVKHNEVYAPSDHFEVFYQQPSVWANIYKTSFIKDNGIYFLETPGASYQDTAFSFKVYSMAERFEMIDKPLLHYRTDNDASSSVQATTKVYCVCDEYNEIKRFVREKDLYEKYRYLVPHLQYRGYNWNYNRLAEPFNEEFMKTWQKEFHDENKNGNINPDVFSKKEYDHAIKIVNSFSEEDEKNVVVSVVVPVFNMEKYLRKCLDSLVGQTLKNIEIICVNDGSTDSSLDILKEYESRDSRIVIIDKKNGGLSSARNIGMRAATSEFIGFVDSDDWVEPETYEIALKNIENVDLVHFGTNVVGDYMLDRRDADNEYYRVKYSGALDLNNDMRLDMDVATWNKLYRKSIIEKYGLEFPEGRLYEDYPFFWNYVFASKKAYFEPQKMYNYLRRTGSIMQQTFAGTPRAIDHIHAAQLIYDFLKENDLLDKHRDAFNSIFVNCFWFAYQNSDKKNKERVLKQSTNMVKKMDLHGDHLFHILRYRQYEKIDHNRSPLRIIAIKLGLKILKKMSGDDLVGLESLFPEPISWQPNLFDTSRKLATTEWVTWHEGAWGVDRWFAVYDGKSHLEHLHWNAQGGLSGGQKFNVPGLSQCIVPGYSYRAALNIEGIGTTMVFGKIFDDSKNILGNTIFDGKGPVSISVEFNPKEETVQVYAYKITGKKDVSSTCKLLRVDRA